MSLQRIVLGLAEGRHGVLTLARATASGVGYETLRSMVESGALVREAEGVFRAVGAPRTYEQRLALAIGAAGGRAWVAAAAAARLSGYGRPWFDNAGPEIVIPHDRSAVDASRFARVRRTRNLDQRDMAVFSGLPTTSPLRTVVDLLAYKNRPALYAFADDVLFRAGPHPADALRAVHRRSRRAGGAVIDLILAPWDHPGPPPDSPKEMSLVRVLYEAGLPLPERQVPIVDPRTRRVIARADHAYAAHRLAIEYLGGRPHGIRQAHGDDLRDEDLQALGWHAAYARSRHLGPPGSDGYVAEVCDRIGWPRPR
jgi:hypothetical protein